MSTDLDTLLRRSFTATNGAAAALEVMAEEGEWLAKMMKSSHGRFAIMTRPLGRSLERPSHALPDVKKSEQWAPLTTPVVRAKQKTMDL